MKPAPFRHIKADSARAAAKSLADGGKVISGGQSLGPMLNLRLARPSAVVGLNGIPGITGIREEKGTLIFGAAATHARIEDGDSPVPLPAMMRGVARGIAYRAVRGKGTIGGSLAHADPAADWLTTLTALDAAVVIENAKGKTRRVPVSGFMLGAYRTVLEPSELVTSIEIRAEMRDALWGYYKVCRKVGEFADAIGALVVHPETGFIRLVAGATDGRPLILTELAAELAGSATRPDRVRVSDALSAKLPDMVEVKRHLMTTALCRAIEKVIPA